MPLYFKSLKMEGTELQGCAWEPPPYGELVVGATILKSELMP